MNGLSSLMNTSSLFKKQYIASLFSQISMSTLNRVWKKYGKERRKRTNNKNWRGASGQFRRVPAVGRRSPVVGRRSSVVDRRSSIAGRLVMMSTVRLPYAIHTTHYKSFAHKKCIVLGTTLHLY